jgi:hypothetical protein
MTLTDDGVPTYAAGPRAVHASTSASKHQQAPASTNTSTSTTIHSYLTPRLAHSLTFPLLNPSLAQRK